MEIELNKRIKNRGKLDRCERTLHIPIAPAIYRTYCRCLLSTTGISISKLAFFSVLLFRKGLYILDCQFQKHLSYLQNKDRYARTFVMNTKLPSMRDININIWRVRNIGTCPVYMIFGGSRCPCCGLPL